ncbi:MAG: glycerol kinase GlpK [Caulobacteraceae bacterium]|nr:glycerol kinase GlpK [Caulobacteraceae bacterium]
MILAIDQGTTSTRAIVFGLDWKPRALRQIELQQHYPHPGWVEHDAEEIWRATLQTCREAIRDVGGVGAIAAVGITNQRETTTLWERSTGAPLHRSIVWQDRRTADLCNNLAAQGLAGLVQDKTGLVLDPYFSATKIAWLLDQVSEGRSRAARGELCAGTIDAFLVHRLTAGASFATDVTNASRTSLMSLKDSDWDDELLAAFSVPREVLPRIQPCAGGFGVVSPELFGKALPITGIAGDQQAALVGHAALRPGEVKVTYGTGAFLVINVGPEPRHSRNKLLATVAYETGQGRAFALEGSIFSAGSTVQWLRDGLKLIEASRESEAIAQALADNGGVYLVPAFTGLGAPHWEPNARGAIMGLTRDTTRAHLVRAGLEALAYQTHDLLEALASDGAPRPAGLKVDGGVTANAWAMQFLADVTGCPVERPAFQEMTALGAARLAALGAGLIDTLGVAPAESPARWEPRMPADQRDRLLAGWKAAVRGALAAAGA